MISMTITRLPQVRTEIPNADSDYNAENFENAFYKIIDAQTADLNTEEGRRKLGEAIGYNRIGGYNRAHVDVVKEGFVGEGLKDLKAHSKRHVGSLADVVDEEDRLNLSLNYGPGSRSENDDYNVVTEAIGGMRETLRKIKEREGEYYTERLNGLEEISKAFYSRPSIRKNIIKQDKAYAQAVAGIAVQKYGSSRFIADTAAFADELKQKADEAEESLNSDMTDSVREKQIETGRPLNVNETIEIQTQYADRIKDVDNLRGDVGRIDKMLGELMALSAAKLRVERERGAA